MTKEEKAIYNKKWQSAHPVYASKKSKEWKAAHVEEKKVYDKRYHKDRLMKDPLYQRRYAYKKLYGISLEEKERILASQNRCCAICGIPDAKKWCVDHDHFAEVTTGEIVIRGILCSTCNFLLGHAKDNESILLAAVEYLRKNGK